MRHILPPTPKKVIFEPKRTRRNFKRKHKAGSRRELMFKDYYGQPVKKGIPRWLIIGLIVVGLVLIVQSFFNLPVFRIEQVHISGMKYLSEAEVRGYIDQELLRRRWIIFKNNNYFLVSINRMKDRLENEYFLNVEELKKDFPDTLIVKVQERIAAFVLQTPTQYIQLDTRGEWIGEVTGPSGTQSIIADERTEFGSAIPTDFLENATIIKDNWEQLVPQLQLNKFHLTDDLTRIEVSTDRQFRVYFSPDKELPPQLRRLSIFLEEANLDEPGQYIDLRFDEKLYSI